METFSKFVPFLSWVTDYNVRKLRLDFVTGLTVAVILISQVVAYVMLAGLPSVYGLYAAFGVAVGSLWGSSA